MTYSPTSSALVSGYWFYYKEECTFMESYPLLLWGLIIYVFELFVPVLMIQFLRNWWDKHEGKNRSRQVTSISMNSRGFNTLISVWSGQILSLFFLIICIPSSPLFWYLFFHLVLLSFVWIFNPGPNPIKTVGTAEYNEIEEINKTFERLHFVSANLIFILLYVDMCLVMSLIDNNWQNAFLVTVFTIATCCYVALWAGYMKHMKEESDKQIFNPDYKPKDPWASLESHWEHMYVIITLIVIVGGVKTGVPS